MRAVVRPDRRPSPELRCPWCRAACDRSAPWGTCPRDRASLHHACVAEFRACPSCGQALSTGELLAPGGQVAVRLVPRRTDDDRLPWAAVVLPTALVALALGATLPLAIGAGLVLLVLVRRGAATGPTVEAAPAPTTAPPRLRVLPPAPRASTTLAEVPLVGPPPTPRAVALEEVPLAAPPPAPLLGPPRLPPWSVLAGPPPPLAPLPSPIPIPAPARPTPLRRPSDSLPIEDACVMRGIGPGVVASLRRAGIRTLGDVTRARLARVRGVGPWRTRQLLAWVALRRG